MWLDSLGMTKASTLIPKLKEICSDHFRNQDIESSFGKKRLKNGALPTCLTGKWTNPEVI
nr:unnamed protein product [Callosobruchus analis]